MASDLVTQRGGRFHVEVHHNFGGRGIDLLDFLKGLDNKLRNGVIRKMVGAAGQVLVKEVRAQINRRDMPYSRARGYRKSDLKLMATTPLKYTITKRVWSKPQRGIIGCVVGPSWPAGAHGHLVEFGHRITGHARREAWRPSVRLSRGKLKFKMRKVKIGRRDVARGGQRTIAHGFQQEAMGNVERDIFLAMASKMSAALKKAGNPHIVRT